MSTSAASDTGDDDVQVDRNDWIGAVVIVGVFVGIVVYNLLRDPDVSPLIEIALWMGMALLALGLVVWMLRRYSRKYETVAKWTRATELVLIVLLVGVVPVVVLDRPDQIFVLKIGSILILSMIPGYIYLQFLAVRGKTLLREFLRNLVRLGYLTSTRLPDQDDDEDRTDSDIRFYLIKFEAVYGRRDRTERRAGTGPGAAAEDKRQKPARIRGETLVPVLWLTVLISIGWALILEPEVVSAFGPLPDRLVISGRPALLADPLRFAFVGAYFFIVQMLVRRYFQDDLKADAYMNALVRVLSAVLITAVVSLVWPDSWGSDELSAFAFLVGIFPRLGIELVRRLVQKVFSGVIPSLEVDYPLSDLDGLNVFYESRLLEEGIEDMQNLATTDIVQLMVRTRVPVERMVDWIDQAHLYLRLEPSRGDDPTKSPGLADRNSLRQHGIRTATGLQDAYGDVTGSKPAPDEYIRDLDALLGDTNGLSRMRTILITLEHEPNLRRVQSWRASRPEVTVSFAKSALIADLGGLPRTPDVGGVPPIRDAERSHARHVAEAVTEFVQQHGAQELDPDSADGLQRLASMYRRMGDRERAIEFLVFAGHAAPTDPVALTEAGRIATDDLGDYDRAKQFYERALLVRPKDPSITYHQARNAALAGDPPRAIELLEKAIAADSATYIELARSESGEDGPFGPLAGLPEFEEALTRPPAGDEQVKAKKKGKEKEPSEEAPPAT